ncbi:MAG: hypothetical protein GKR89_14610 [Candidatus Latescibacteria bacterium]|nr:hypothetical protein [Candidatus Latescibacterota bacterium]
MTDNHELIVCGWDEVFILDFNQRDNGQPKKVWSWKAEACADLPDSFKPLFKTTDECKPFDGGNKVLITSSGGAVAYVDRRQNQVLFYGRAANAHSADILPDNRVAVAASHDPAGQGDRLILFDLNQSDRPLWHDTLSWAHGVVWDDHRQQVWALASGEIKVYTVVNWQTTAPELDQIATVVLPESGGHDLYPVSDSYLSVSTGKHCWLLDRDKRTLSAHPDLADQMRVKCISQHPKTKQTVYVQGTNETWWTETLRFLNPEATYFVPNEHFYKARWSIRME